MGDTQPERMNMARGVSSKRSEDIAMCNFHQGEASGVVIIGAAGQPRVSLIATLLLFLEVSRRAFERGTSIKPLVFQNRSINACFNRETRFG
jgi:hypothetical protein